MSVTSKGIAMSSRSMVEVEVAKRLNLEEAVAMVLVMAVLVVVLVLLDMKKDLPMMKEDHTYSWCSRHTSLILRI